MTSNEDYYKLKLFSDEEIVLNSSVIEKGHGRGRRDWGIATANFSTLVSKSLLQELKGSGIYFGFAKIIPTMDGSHHHTEIETDTETDIYPMVASLGWNPFFKDPTPTFEAHLIGYSGQDFYGLTLAVAIMGYLRPEQNYPSLEELVKAINNDIEKAHQIILNTDTKYVQNQLAIFSNKLTL